jgi:hypothetical protein
MNITQHAPKQIKLIDWKKLQNYRCGNPIKVIDLVGVIASSNTSTLFAALINSDMSVIFHHRYLSFMMSKEWWTDEMGRFNQKRNQNKWVLMSRQALRKNYCDNARAELGRRAQLAASPPFLVSFSVRTHICRIKPFCLGRHLRSKIHELFKVVFKKRRLWVGAPQKASPFSWICPEQAFCLLSGPQFRGSRQFPPPQCNFG